MRFLMLTPGLPNGDAMVQMPSGRTAERAAELLRQTFEGVELVAVGSSAAYREALGDGRFDLVLTDYPLAWSDGLAMLHEARTRLPGVPVMMITGAGSEAVAVEGMKAGLCDYIPAAGLSRLPDAVRAGLGPVPDLPGLPAGPARFDFLQSALDDAYSAMSYIDQDLVFRYCNAAAGRQLGRRPEEVVGHHLHAVVPDQAMIWDAVEGVLASGEPFDEVTRFTRTDSGEPGEQVYRMHYVPHRNERGDVVGCLCEGAEPAAIAEPAARGRDQEDVEVELAARTAELNATFDALPSGLILYGPQGEVVRMNAAARLTGGYSAQDQSLPLSERMLAREVQWENGMPVLDSAEMPLGRALRGESLTGVVLSWKPDPDHDRRWFSVSAAPVRGADGSVEGAVSSFVDITERQGLLEEAEERAAELDAVLDAIADGVVVYGSRGEIRRMNGAARRLLPYSGRQWAASISQRVRAPRPVHRDGSAYSDEEFPAARALRGEMVRAEVMGFGRGHEDAFTWVSVSAAPIYEAGGVIRGAVATAAVVTELLRIQKGLTEAQGRLEEQATELEEQAVELRIQNDELIQLSTYLGFERARLAAILENLGEAFISFDRAWQITYVNAVAEACLERSRSELLGNDFRQMASAYGDYVAPLTQTMDEGTPVTFEIHVAAQQLWYEVRGYTAPRGLSVFFRDVTARKQAEAERERLLAEHRQQRAHLEAVLAQMPSGVVVAEVPSGRVILSNARAKEILRCAPGTCDFFGVGDACLGYHPDGRRYARDEWPPARSVHHGEVILGEEITIPRRDGSRAFIRVNSAPVIDEQGVTTCAVAIFLDVTKSRELAQELHRERELLQAVFHAIPVMLAIFDPATGDLEFSEHFHELTGWTRDELGEMSVSRVLEQVYPDPAFHEDFVGAMDVPASGYHDVEMIAKSGVVIDTSWAHVRLADGRRVGIGIDIRARRAAERRQAFLAELGDRLRGLRAPAAMMDAAAELLGRYLGVSRVGCAEIDDEGETATLRDWTDGTVASIAGYYPVASWGVDCITTYRQGRVWWTDDVAGDLCAEVREAAGGYAAMGIGAMAAVPLAREGQWRALIFVSATQPHCWTKEHLALIQETAERLWEALERARAEDALRTRALELESANQANQMLLREINHRVKNNLTAILGLIYAEQRRLKNDEDPSRRTAPQCEEVLENLSERVRSLATAHGLLSAGGWRALRLDRLVGEVIGASVLVADESDELSLQVSGVPITVTPVQAHHLALVIGELATNTAKYGRAPNGLQVHVDIAMEEGSVRLIYRDRGPGYPEPVLAGEGRSVGLGLVNTIVSISLRGMWQVRNEDGAVSEIQFPAADRPALGATHE